MKEDLEKYLGRQIVLDTRSSWVYLGTLENVTDESAILKNADVHDSSDTSTSKDLYVFESRQTGVKPNRSRVYVNLNQVISFSLIEEIKKF
ncbi:hypothetical protein [Desulfospira joergensenii]|uniref:hypothetical protein n=1 Tax=Desulfospira joergensenii TaxID=53329 RepID=UPI0003B4F349|nr:hypothetical protein [Desulfospira joergensenii]